MIEGKNIKFSYALENLYEDASFRILNNEHVVLVGANGVGKSTLMKMIAKLINPDQGEVIHLPKIKVGYLDQYMSLDDNLLVYDYLSVVYKPLFEKEQTMLNYYDLIASNTLNDDEVNNYLNYAALIQDELMETNFYQVKSEISNIINGLGLSMDVLSKPIKELSSGMRSKVILGKLLLENNDLLLLDEPTNFLDVTHVNWLANFLKTYDKAFLVISHNEAFLKEIANVVLAVEHKKVNRYKGDYDFYLTEREVRFTQQVKEYENQQKLIKETEEFINKNIVRASTTKRAQSRRKMLNKMTRVSKISSDRTYQFDFPIKLQTGKEVLKIENLVIGYNNNPLLDPINFTIRNQDKVVITGKNGIGKSTLIKTVMDELDKIDGSFKWDKNVSFSYLKQDDFYQNNDTAFNVVGQVYHDLNKTQTLNLLANYGINYEMANRPINTLSGGEQTKIKIALLKNNYGNVLVFDEPTNHLDVAAKEALKEALISYQGTLILVSHEQEFYEEICDYEISLF